MIAVDTSSWVAYLQGDAGNDVELLDRALEDRTVMMPPVVLTELLSDPRLPEAARAALLGVPLVDCREGYWERAGMLRAQVLRSRRKARLGDALIAQSCLDANLPLITRDRDFQALAAVSALELHTTSAVD